MAHNFRESLELSHKAADLPCWKEAYQKAFPTMVAMVDHRLDGNHQRLGIDRSVTLANSKQILIDEKVRFRNKKTEVVYTDIALEYIADAGRRTPGWVCKPLLSDYIAYAIAPIGRCYLLPVPQLQEAWRRNAKRWLEEAEDPNGDIQKIYAENYFHGANWTTVSCCVPPEILFPAIGQCLRVEFTPFEEDEAFAVIDELKKQGEQERAILAASGFNPYDD